MKLNREERKLLNTVLLKYEHELEEEFRKALKDRDYDLQKRYQREFDRIDDLIEKLDNIIDEK